jgi:hypothetical protein
MTDEAQNPEKKIIVDEDWKSQVEAERETLREQKTASPPPPPAANLPPANLSYLAGTLYLQAAIALGILPNPAAEKDKQYQVHLNVARHAIDMLQVLQEKTEGNRTPDESEEIEAMLHQLRLAYVEVSRTGEGAGGI